MRQAAVQRLAVLLVLVGLIVGGSAVPRSRRSRTRRGSGNHLFDEPAELTDWLEGTSAEEPIEPVTQVVDEGSPDEESSELTDGETDDLVAWVEDTHKESTKKGNAKKKGNSKPPKKQTETDDEASDGGDWLAPEVGAEIDTEGSSDDGSDDSLPEKPVIVILPSSHPSTTKPNVGKPSKPIVGKPSKPIVGKPPKPTGNNNEDSYGQTDGDDQQSYGNGNDGEDGDDDDDDSFEDDKTGGGDDESSSEQTYGGGNDDDDNGDSEDNNGDYSAPVFSGGVCEKKNEHQGKFTLSDTSEAGCKKFLTEVMPELKKRINKKAKASWQLKCEQTDENFNEFMSARDHHTSLLRGVAKRARSFDNTRFEDKDLKRTVRKLRKCGYSALKCDKYDTLQNSLSGMKKNHDSCRVCKYRDEHQCDLQLRPHVENIMASSRDPEELKHYWTQWHHKAGKPSKQMFHKYVELASEAASLNGFPSMGDYWLDAYEHRRFKEEMSNVMDKIAPLYMQLHGYVRYKIRQSYGHRYQKEYGPIQISLLGDMSGQNWEHISSFAMPYKRYRHIDVTEEMLVQDYTPRKMFQLADEYLMSLNMTRLPKSFWDNSEMTEVSPDSDVSCEASVHDMYDRNDVRVKMCSEVNNRDLISVHNLVAQAQYSLQYRNQPTIYREPSCPGFRHAVGQVISLCASTPHNLERVHLLNRYRNTRERRINRLFVTALQKVPLLPFIYSVEKFRMKTFRHAVKPDNYNCKFWELRSKYSGVEPPVNRTNEDCDLTALHEVCTDTESIQQFFSTVAQFQMHRATCKLAGEYKCKPRRELCDCNIHNSKPAGEALKSVLRMGSSKPWTELMEDLTGYKGLHAGPMLEYFQPLYDWLVKFNQKHHVPLGWSQTTRCPSNCRKPEDEYEDDGDRN